MSNRVIATLAKPQKLLVSYIVAGFPSIEASVQQMHALVVGGTDIIELGVPFSDPSAEGNTIAAAHFEALNNGCNLHRVFAIVEQFRRTNATTPVILMGYTNPFLHFGYSQLATQCQQSGVDGILSVDSSLIEMQVLQKSLHREQIVSVFLVSPTTIDQRIAEIACLADSFIYYISLKGVTGSDAIDIDEVKNKLKTVKQHSNLPILVGFGIRTAEQVQQLSAICKGVVIGSHYINCINQNPHQPESLAEVASVFAQALKR